MTALLQTKQATDDFVRAIEQWLSGEVTGYLGPYMYTDDSDDRRWKQGHSSPHYYLGVEDKACFDLAIRELAIKADNLIDLGPGGEASVIAKSIPLAQAVQAGRYFPVDLSTALADSAVNTMKVKGNILGHPVIADFFKPMPLREPNSLVAFMGGTLANIETYNDKDLLQNRLTKVFNNLAEATCRQGHLLVSLDANSNAKEIVDCYANPQIGGLIRSCVDRAINTDGFDFDVVWSADNYQLAMGLRAKQDQVISFNGGQYSFEQGEFVPVLNSYRFPLNFTKEAAARAGWDYQRAWSARGRVHYLLFKCGL